MMAPDRIIVPTPIGKLGDIMLRAVEVIQVTGPDLDTPWRPVLLRATDFRFHAGGSGFESARNVERPIRSRHLLARSTIRRVHLL